MSDDQKPQESVFDNLNETLSHAYNVIDGLKGLKDRHGEVVREIRDAHARQMEKLLEDKTSYVGEVIDRRDREIAFLKGVIGDLCHRIERTQQQLRRDNQMCAYSEPLDIMNLLGRETDPAKVIQKAREKRRADEVRKAKKAAEPNAVECDCGRTWPDGKMAPGHGDMYCQASEGVCVVPTCCHPEARHTRELPEEGGRAYCTECNDGYAYHEFTPGS